MMVKTGNRFRELAAWWFVIAVLAVSGGLSGCAAARTGETRERTIWQVRDQYVKIEKQDRPAGGEVSVNTHPADVSADRLRNVLGSLQLRPRGEDKPVPLFNEDELNILSENIHAGLASAASDEDVTFAIIGHYPVLMGMLKERMVTTGRVFSRDGKLDIIFGDVHRTVRENEDRRLYPFLPGSRGASAPREWRLVAMPGGEAFDLKRPDWLSFSLAATPTPAVAPPASESRGPEKKAAPPAAAGKPAPAGKRTLEERLMILNDLRNKKLITDEEYRAKRLEILNEL